MVIYLEVMPGNTGRKDFRIEAETERNLTRVHFKLVTTIGN